MKVFEKIRKSRWSCGALVAMLIPSVTFVTVPVSANPAGGVVARGIANISGGGGNLTINQSSNLAIINWQNFSIDLGQSVRFNQPGVNSLALNRVTGVNPSSIYGTLSANGGILLINQNGIMVGPTGVIDVGGALTLSTLDIDDDDFMNGGTNRFSGNSGNGVVNHGNIRSSDGDVMFLGGFAHNFNSIESTRGTVALAAGSDMIVGQSGEATISIRSGSSYTGTGVNQQGTITGAATELQAHGNAFALAINSGGLTRATGGYRRNGRSVLRAMGGSNRIVHTGRIEARNPVGRGGSVSIEGGDVDINGAIDVSGVGANDAGTVDVIADSLVISDTSEILASSTTRGGSVNLTTGNSVSAKGLIDVSSIIRRGGDVTIIGDRVEVDAEIVATGGVGGTIKAGGDFQGTTVNGLRGSESSVIGSGATFDVSATAGDAGQIIVWSDGDTIFEGEARANATGAVGNGGLIEVSGKQNLTFRGLVSATSRGGRSGTVLFDPGTLTILNAATAGVNQILTSAINTTLQGGTSVLLATQGADSDIIFQDNGDDNDWHDAIQWTNSDSSFGAFAGGNVIIETHIRTSGAGSINIIGGWDATEASAAALFTGNVTSPTGVIGTTDVAGTGGLGIQDIFNQYVAAGDFGENDGNVFVGNSSLNHNVVVGSRYGDTNIAAASVLLTASDFNGESLYAQIGFHDSGMVFSPRLGTLDLNNRALETDNNPLVGIAGFNERADGMGVYAINSEGVHNGDGTLSSGTDATFIPYANHYMDGGSSDRQGNWWWQQIHHDSTDVTNADGRYVASYDVNDLGGNRPEMGAGQSLSDTADINIIAKQNVILQSGGRHQSGAYIGHGGDSAGWADQRAIRNSGIENGQTQRYWSQNGASNDRSAISIARLAPVYGHINVLAGVDNTQAVSINKNGVVSATIAPGQGSVLLLGRQVLGSSNAPTNDATNSGQSAPVQIGHGGVGQFGEFNGDIQVRAGASVTVLAASGSRSYGSIGHSVAGYHYWDPPSNADAQIRFFANDGDFDDPLLRRGELFSGTTNIAQSASGDTFTGTRTVGGNDLSDPITGAVTVEALDGSVVNGFHGDITVQAVAGNITVQGYSTDTDVSTNRERRFAKIGHGGFSFAVWAEESGYVPNRTDRNREQVNFRIPNDGSETGSATIIGETGQSLNRHLSFMTITGDIEVRAGRDITVKAGNDLYDFAKIGHGGEELADWETSSFIAGNIDITAGGELIIEGGGATPWTATGDPNVNTVNFGRRDFRSYAHVGHGGYHTGFLALYGDIDVVTGDDITLTGGAYGGNYAKIGHKGTNEWGQVGGDLTRNENFNFDGVSTDITTEISGSTATITYGGDTANLSGGSATPRVHNLTTNTANISVNSGGSIRLLHLDASTKQNANQLALGTNAGGFISTLQTSNLDEAYAQIGHGGTNWTGEYYRNSRTNYDEMVGNVSVTAATDIIMEGGNREGMWSRIGHGLTGGGLNIRLGEEMLISGAISVNAGRDVILDGSAAAEMDINQDAPAKDNGLAIGHGAFAEDSGGSRGDMAVLDGADINGITLASTITVNAGRDVTVIGGNGAQDVAGEIGASGTHSQIGHGYSSINGDNISTKGFNGDINVSALHDLTLRATNNGIIFNAAGDIVISSAGGAAVIGNGGIFLDAPASGDITVYAGNDINMISPPRLSEDINFQGTQSDGGSTFLNFTKIGHFSTEAQSSGVVNVGLLEGDISVVAGGNMTMTAGQTPNHSSGDFLDFSFIFPGDHLIDTTGDGFGDTVDDQFAGEQGRQGVTGAFSQVGHGGPGIAGNLTGDIEVLVGGNLTTNDGTIDSSGQVTPFSGNNYNKIGHGDWMRDGIVGFRGSATGVATGDIVVAVGESADFEHTLIGHNDPTISGTLPGVGETFIAVSRNFPLYSGSGKLTVTGVTEQTDAIGDTLIGTGQIIGSVLTSGSGGADLLNFYMPERANNLLEIGTTRLNTSDVFYNGNAGTRPTGTPGGSGPLAGNADEVFLAPDLWWMSAEGIADATALGYDLTGIFPTSATGDQGGAIATVDGDGGIPNLTTLTAGALGSSINGSLSRSGHGLSGGQYTLFFDALVPVSSDFPAPPPPPPPPPPNVAAFVFSELFDSFQRQQDGFDGIFGSQGIDSIFNEDLAYNGQLNDELGLPNSPVESFLDMMLGPRKSGPSSSQGALQASGSYDDGPAAAAPSEAALEDAEENERRANRNRRPLKIQPVYYLFSPGSQNPYSSFNVFGDSQ